MRCPDCSAQLYDSRWIKARTMAALNRYVFDHLPPGDFLYAVFTNDLRRAFALADEENLSALPAIVSYMYNHMPADCQGSQERVRKWLAHED